MKQKIQAVLSLLMATAIVFACATVQQKHVASVSLVGIGQTLGVIQDTERVMVCGRTTALPAPQCVPIDKHNEISRYLSRAFDLKNQAERIAVSLPVGSPTPTQILDLVSEIGGLVEKVLPMLPSGLQKDQLTKTLQGGK